mmetsp:Transcript_18114/g.42879  ORF Transcript_18114/g.42879 Transcript_18114/m.42879 type:complete len:243 (+) Transcript_18114:596-1324(+)
MSSSTGTAHSESYPPGGGPSGTRASWNCFILVLIPTSVFSICTLIFFAACLATFSAPPGVSGASPFSSSFFSSLSLCSLTYRRSWEVTRGSGSPLSHSVKQSRGTPERCATCLCETGGVTLRNSLLTHLMVSLCQWTCSSSGTSRAAFSHVRSSVVLRFFFGTSFSSFSSFFSLGSLRSPVAAASSASIAPMAPRSGGANTPLDGRRAFPGVPSPPLDPRRTPPAFVPASSVAQSGTCDSFP